MRNVEGLILFCLYLFNLFEEDKIFKRFLFLGVDVIFGDNIGVIFFMMVCFLNNFDYVLVLIYYGVNVNVYDIYG